MPIRFHRTLKIAPGVKLNLSKSGVSTTVGPKGIHFTFNKHGIRRSIGIPGTGLSEVDYIKKNGTAEERREEKSVESHEASERAHPTAIEHPNESKHTHGRERTGSASLGLRNALVLLSIVIFFFAGAAVLGLMPAHFFSNSLQYIAHLAQSTGH